AVSAATSNGIALLMYVMPVVPQSHMTSILSAPVATSGNSTILVVAIGRRLIAPLRGTATGPEHPTHRDLAAGADRCRRGPDQATGSERGRIGLAASVPRRRRQAHQALVDDEGLHVRSRSPFPIERKPIVRGWQRRDGRAVDIWDSVG